MTADKVMSVAKSYIGTVEKPAGSNNVIFNTHYYGTPVSGSAYPWCCAFVWDCFRMAGASSLFFDGKKTAYCPSVQDWAKKNNLVVNKKNGQYGDIILFDWNDNDYADHIGFVLENKGNGVYTTIEGNTSVTSNDNGGKVMQRTRYPSDIVMIVRPKYKTTTQSVAKTTTGGYVMKDFRNTSGKSLAVYSDTKKAQKVGEVYAGTNCKALDQQGTMVCIRYKVNTTGAYKVGWVEYVKGVT